MKWLDPIGARIIPANFGPLRGFNALARIVGDCGDTMEYGYALEESVIQRASFSSDGCETSVACGSVAAHLSQDKSNAEMRRV